MRQIIISVIIALLFGISDTISIQAEGVSQVYKTITLSLLRDKIAGGWAGKMIGVTYGAPTEFRAQGKTYEDSLVWEPSMIRGALEQDDLYVQLSFMMTMDKYGIDAPAAKFAQSFAEAGYRLWHANVQARKNYFDGIMPPLSGSPEYNYHADDIDFQIEADYIGFMCPGMPRTAQTIADKIGRIMNYGDGLYGGMFVAALYTEAFFSDDIPSVIEKALLAIPKDSDYARCIRDVVILHDHFPHDWWAAWKELEDKWGEDDICGALSPFNIDAKLNGAYIVMGLLYGGGNFEKTMEVSLRCGQDSDCNPSNAAAVIGVMKGLSGIPARFSGGIRDIADSLFIFTDYSYNSACEKTLGYALTLIDRNGGRVEGDAVTIPIQKPVEPPLEVSFPGVVPSYRISVFADSYWSWKGSWEIAADQRTGAATAKPYAKRSSETGAEATFSFTGTGVVLYGDWLRNGGQADVFVDDVFHRTIDTYYWHAGEDKSATLWHIFGLAPGRHTVTLAVTGKKKPESIGADISLTGAAVFTTGRKKSETYNFSFEKK